MTTCDAAYTTYVDGHPFYDFTGPLPVEAPAVAASSVAAGAPQGGAL